MLFNKRHSRRNYYRYRYFRVLKLYFNLAVFVILISIISSIVKFIGKNTSAVAPLVFVVIIFIIMYKPISKFIKRYLDYRKFSGVNLSTIQFNAILRALSPRQFEVFTAELFQALGNEIYLSADGPDGGKDVIVNKSIYVECKRYNSSIIGREICQKLLGAVEADGMEKGILFTNGQINNNAIEFLKKTKRLELWKTDRIYQEFNSLENYKASLVLDTALQYIEEATVVNELTPQPN